MIVCLLLSLSLSNSNNVPSLCHSLLNIKTSSQAAQFIFILCTMKTNYFQVIFCARCLRDLQILSYFMSFKKRNHVSLFHVYKMFRYLCLSSNQVDMPLCLVFFLRKTINVIFEYFYRFCIAGIKKSRMQLLFIRLWQESERT